MKLIKLALLVLALALSVGFSSKLPNPTEGTYPVKLKTFTIFDLMDMDSSAELYFNTAELTESKPENLQFDFEYEKMADYKFGAFKFGNNERKVWFVMGKDDQGFWTEYYIDQNLDNRITQKEKIKSFRTEQGSAKGYKTTDVFSLIPIPVRVSYKGQSSEIEKNLFFFILIKSFAKNKNVDTVVQALTASFLEGEVKVAAKNEFLVKYRILDGDANGCFNDYGKDLILMDLNHDGYFKKNETRKLVEFYDIINREKQKKQLRLIVMPIPAKIAVTEATSDYDRTQLEAQTDLPVDTNSKEEAKPTVSQPPATI